MSHTMPKITFGLAMALCISAHAIDLPSLESLSPRWTLLSVGTPQRTATQLMGRPYGREDAQVLGVERTTLHWKDLQVCYEATFVFDRLYKKSTLEVGTTGKCVAQA